MYKHLQDLITSTGCLSRSSTEKGKWSWYVILQNGSRSPNTYSLLTHFLIMFPDKFTQNVLILSSNLPSKSWRDLEIGSRSPNSNQVFYLFQLHNTPSLIWIHEMVQEMEGRQAFLVNPGILLFPVTLKTGSISPKSNHFFPLSQWCSNASLVGIHRFVLWIECRQGSFLQTYWCGDLENKVKVTKI